MLESREDEEVRDGDKKEWTNPDSNRRPPAISAMLSGCDNQLHHMPDDDHGNECPHKGEASVKYPDYYVIASFELHSVYAPDDGRR